MGAEELTRALGGRWNGHYGLVCCPAHDDRQPSLSVSDGDTGQLLLHCHAGCEYAVVRCALEDRLSRHLDDVVSGASRSKDVSRQAAIRPLVDRLWHEAQPADSTLVERYLRGRAIRGPIPPSLRFHAALRHISGRRLPAMLARVEDCDGCLVALHRTYLDAARATKAYLQPSKAMLGPCKGNAVRLRRGETALVVCEGIETALSLSDALDGGQSVWAALSASGVAGLLLPDMARFDRQLLVACDGDAAGRRAGIALAQRAAVLGWSVKMLQAPDGTDFNDLARDV